MYSATCALFHWVCQLLFLPTCAFYGPLSNGTMLIHKGNGYTMKANTMIKTAFRLFAFLRNCNNTVESAQLERFSKLHLIVSLINIQR